MLSTKTVNVNLTTHDYSYPILIGDTVKSNLTQYIPEFIRYIIIISDTNIDPLYAVKLKSYLMSCGYLVHRIIFPAGENSKNRETKTQIEDQMLELELSRKNSLVIALGGGVVGDIAGFVAATYLRGIALIQIPTSLLAMIDSSVGGKTGINTQYGKNLIVAFYQPIAVLCDLNYLVTLPKKEL